MTERLGSGLQNRPQQFESAWHLKKKSRIKIFFIRLFFIFQSMTILESHAKDSDTFR